MIIPCYNEEQALPIFAGELDKVRQELRQYDFEVLMVNDGSSDKTLETMKKISEEYDYFKYLSFSRNFGKEAAMYAGFCNADGDYVAVMDADMQDPPSLLPEMLGILEQGEYDSVATRRVTRKGEPPIRSWFARMFYKIINKISDADVVDGARDFRLMKAEMKDAIVSMCEYNRFSKGIFGIFCTFVAFVMMLFFFIRKLVWGDPVAGWPSLVCIILFVSGLQFLCIGIMGKYIAKTYMETKSRPHYIISDTNKDDVNKIN